MSKGKEVISFKVITIGDSNVGKTSIIRRYVYNVFEEDTMSTIGLSFSFKEVILKSGEKINLKLVDTAGQEKYHSLTTSYFKNSDCVLFVFDYGNLDSFNHIQKWVEDFTNNTTQIDIPKYLIGNKEDLDEKKVTKEMIENFLKEKNYKFKSTSAIKNDNHIEELFNEIAEDVMKKYLSSSDKGQKSKQLKNFEKKNIKGSNCICKFNPEN